MLNFLKDNSPQKITPQLEVLKSLIASPRPLDALRWAEKSLSDDYDVSQTINAIIASGNVALAKEFQGVADTYTVIVIDNCIWPDPPTRDGNV